MIIFVQINYWFIETIAMKDLFDTILNHQYDEDTEVLELVETKEEEVSSHHLVVYNDEVNTFDHVIDTLIDVCEHSPEQAEQCTWIIHYKGKCSVKTGSLDDLAKRKTAICDRGISAEVL